jgi:hypothetical protein
MSHSITVDEERKLPAGLSFFLRQHQRSLLSYTSAQNSPQIKQGAAAAHSAHLARAVADDLAIGAQHSM